MTHDELLIMIEDKFDNHNGLHDAQIVNALYSVVELHKPQPTTISSDLKCSACSGLDWCDYPCPTIKGIESALNG